VALFPALVGSLVAGSLDHETALVSLCHDSFSLDQK
jgi:hypothetical protein